MKKLKIKPTLLDNIKSLMNDMNKYGISIPTIRDSHSGVGSITLTMFVVSFSVTVIGLIGKAAGFLGGIDLNQALMLYGVTGSFYLGRKYQKKGDMQTISEEPENDDDSQE